MTNPLNQTDREALTALYVSLDFMKCNDILCDQVQFAIAFIETKIRFEILVSEAEGV